MSEPELVLTVPGPYGAEINYIARSRTTAGVLIQLFVEARREIVLSAPFIQTEIVLRAGAVGEALRAALHRHVRVDILSTRKNVQSGPLTEFAREAGGQVRLFAPALSGPEEIGLGSHAKFCICDGDAAYVGSANLTEPALYRHLELGLLVKGRVASSIYEFWRFCVREGFVIEMP